MFDYILFIFINIPVFHDLIISTRTCNSLSSASLSVKVKVTLEQPTKSQRGNRDITLSLTSAVDERVFSQRHATAALPP